MTSTQRIQSQGNLLLFFLMAGTLTICGCKGGGVLPDNIPPFARVSNIPPPEDTITTKTPRLKLFWLGDDPDGYVTAFRYRWSFRLTKNDPFQYKPFKTILNIIITKFALIAETEDPRAIPEVYKFFATLPPEGLDDARTLSLARGDSILIAGVRVWASNSDSIRLPNSTQRVKHEFPVHENPNTGVFIFDSQDTLNFHTFEVYAVDNLGAVSVQPATVSFQTPIVQPPHVDFITPFPPDTSLVLLHKTDTFPGIRFLFNGNDPNSRTIEYSWVVDKDIWQARTGSIPWSEFSPHNFAFVTASDFPDTFALTHTFYVRARNEFGSIGDYTDNSNTVHAASEFHTVYPVFKDPRSTYVQKILFVDNNYGDPQRSDAHPSRGMVDTFYYSMLDELGKSGSYDTKIVHYDTPAEDAGNFPGLSELGKYSLVIFCADGVDGFQKSRHFTGADRQQILRDYCYVGGKIIFSGWALRSALNMQETPEFFYSVIHVDLAKKVNSITPPQFIGAYGKLGYPSDVNLDTAKMDTALHGAMPNTWLTYPVGFGEFISTFHAKDPNFRIGFITLENQPVAVRYIGVTFNSVFVGFPLYYIDRPTAVMYLRKVLQDIGE